MKVVVVHILSLIHILLSSPKVILGAPNREWICLLRQNGTGKSTITEEIKKLNSDYDVSVFQGFNNIIDENHRLKMCIRDRYELIRAVKEVGSEDAIELLDTLVSGKRLKDISDLPLDLAV